MNIDKLIAFRRNIKVNVLSGCWEWQGDHYMSGYGRIYYKGKQVRAHRLSYEHYVGEIPSHLEIDHLCRNPSCVNPKHLEVVTRSENIKRGLLPEVLRQIQLRKTHCKHGHPYDESNTYKRPDGGRDCKQCQKQRWIKFLRRQKQYA